MKPTQREGGKDRPKDVTPTVAHRAGEEASPTGGICGAKKRNGGICHRPGLANGRCHRHGGKSLKGVAAPGFKNGRYSKALLKLEDDIGDRVNDPKLLDPRRTIAMQEAAMARLSEMVAEGDAPEFRELVKKRLTEALNMMKEDQAEAMSQLRSLHGYVVRGVEESRALMAMQESADKMNRAQTRYWQTAMTASRAISPEEFVQFMFRMADIIESEVDRDTARRILGRADRDVCGGALGLSDSS